MAPLALIQITISGLTTGISLPQGAASVGTRAVPFVSLSSMISSVSLALCSTVSIPAFTAARFGLGKDRCAKTDIPLSRASFMIALNWPSLNSNLLLASSSVLPPEPKNLIQSTFN